MKNVMVDIDGVLADFCHGFTKVAADLGLAPEGGWPVDAQSTWKFDFHVDPVWREIENRHNWWMTLEPISSDEELSMLRRKIDWTNFYRFSFVTNRKNGPHCGFTVQRQTELWLESIGLECGQVYLVENKARWAVENNIDVAIEDKPDNIALLQAMDIKTVTRSWQYNQDSEPRVESLKQFMEEYL